MQSPENEGSALLFMVRSDRDSNSGAAFDDYTLSRRASSATRASLQYFCKMRCKGNYFLSNNYKQFKYFSVNVQRET